MKRTIRLGYLEYEILDRDEPTPWEEVLRFQDRNEALRFLNKFRESPMSLGIFRHFITSGVLQGYVGSMDAGQVMSHLAARLVSRRVRIVLKTSLKAPVAPPSDETTPAKPKIPDLDEKPPPVQKKPEKEKKKTWIKFKVVEDKTGLPVPNVRLHVKLTDQSVKEETTDEDGMVAFYDIDPGTCDLQKVKKAEDAIEILKIEAGS